MLICSLLTMTQHFPNVHVYISLHDFTVHLNIAKYELTCLCLQSNDYEMKVAGHSISLQKSTTGIILSTKGCLPLSGEKEILGVFNVTYWGIKLFTGHLCRHFMLSSQS